jgi:pyruvate kinase
MLSGVSAVGRYPVEAVITMGRICAEAEAYLKSRPRTALGVPTSLSGFVDPITEAAVDAACLMTDQLDAALIVVGAESGRTALALSNRRPTAVIIAIARTERMARILNLCWGVTPVVFADLSSAEAVLAVGIEWAKSRGLVTSGQRAVFLRGEVRNHPDVRAVLAGKIN